MKLLGFKNYLSERFAILKLNLIQTIQLETAYPGGNIGNTFSTLFYTISYLVFIEVIFSNVQTIAGYNRNEILFLTLIGQINFYTIYLLFMNNVKLLIRDVNEGNLDLVLSKPLPHLFYLTFRRLKIISTLRDGLPTIIILCLILQWNELTLSFSSSIAGSIIAFIGIMAFGSFLFLFGLPVFWKGESESLYLVAYGFIDSSTPWEGFSGSLQKIFFAVIPSLIMSQVSTSVFLQKQGYLLPLFFSLSVALLFLFIKIYAWKRAVRQYSSASS